MPHMADWKSLERHPKSAKYVDIRGKKWKQMVEDVTRHGIVGGRSIKLYPDDEDEDKLKIIDGWQLYRSCLEADFEPYFDTLILPPGMDIDEWVRIFNDNRRHESEQEEVERLVRQGRVVAATAAGFSQQQIAETENISRKTVRRDLAKANGDDIGSGGPNVPVFDTPTSPQEVFCDRCKRVGPTKDCKNCAELRPRGRRRVKKEREPGDDSESVATERRKSRNNGKAIFDWRKFNTYLGPVMRLPDDIGKKFQGEKGGLDYVLVSGILDKLAEAIKEWKQKLQGTKGKK